MTTELTYLTLSALLAACLWMPFIIGASSHQPKDVNDDFRRPRDLSSYPAWIHRAHRAHLNLIEQLVPMAILVLIASQVGVSTTITVWCVALFFWLRVAHAIGMVLGIALFPIRPMIFSAGWICILVFAWQLFAHAS